MEIVVGRVGRAHGIRGEVRIETRSDSVDRRFAVGAVVRADRDGRATKLTVRAARPHSGALLVRFSEVTGRTAAEALGGATLYVEVPDDERPDDADEYYDWQLVGLEAQTPAGDAVGEVADVVHLPGQEVLVIRRPNGDEAMVPFVQAFVPSVDVDMGTLVIDDRHGLLEEA